jgi:Cu/Ag efflux protein CusF
MRRLFLAALLALPLAWGLASCKKPESPAAMATPDGQTHIYTGHGVIQMFQSDGRVVVLKHDAIVGFMEGMTRGFELKDAALAKGLQKGDTVDFTLEVTGYDPLITKIVKAGN